MMRRCNLASLLTLAVLWAVPPASASLRLIDAQEVLSKHTTLIDGTLCLVMNGRSWPLVTDPLDSELSTLGDGSFHPFEIGLVREAIASAPAGVASLDARIVVLPYPRRGTLRSSCEGNIVFLSPGLRKVHPEHLAATIAHELGHIVQHALAPDGSTLWEEYLDLRQLHSGRYHHAASHRDRPHEIFAEDYRFLLGPPEALSSPGIENADIPLPTEVAGLVPWFDRLLNQRVAPDESTVSLVSPNPFRAGRGGEVRIVFAASTEQAVHADVVDVVGRRVVRLLPTARGEETTFLWNGRTSLGNPAACGVYFVHCPALPEAEVALVRVLR
ncbi:MAG: hypothetical protein QF819_01830 [Gemmatimonadota bacterium]|jgi:hypothetical protein|nr:hypothetical protein [Gemmatimonadota bacterium]MDP7031630.1 hypothetical protein [Gemmatimonadota bacterium]